MKNSFIFFFLLIIPRLSLSQVIIDEKFKSRTLEDNMQMVRDSTNSLSIDDIIKFEHGLPFKNIPIASPNLGRDTSYHWIAFSLKNTDKSQRNVYLQISQPFIDFFNIYAVENGLVRNQGVFQYEEKLKGGLLPHLARPTFELELQPNAEIKVFIRIKNTAGVMIVGMKLMSREDFFNETSFEHTLYTIFFGIIAAISIISIAFFTISKLRLYLYYGIYIMLINIAFQGLIGNLYNMSSFKLDFINGDSCFRFYSISGLIFNIFFLRKLFEITTKDKWYMILTNILLALCVFVWVVTALDLGYIYYPLGSVLNTYVFFILTSLITVIYNFKRRSQTVKLYIFSFLPIVIVLIIRILSEEGFIPQPTNFSHFVLPALTFEFLILLVGLSKLFIKRLNEKKELEAKIISNQVETQESERRKIAADLHDDLGSTLSVLKDKIGASDNETKELINKAIGDLRSISHNLMPPNFEVFGFIPSIEKYIETLNQHGLKITLIVFGGKRRLHADTELNIYRILTEILHNIRKHSQTKEATIQLIYHPTFLYISVENNDKVEENEEKGVGIGKNSISSRLEYLHARVLEEGKNLNGYSYIFEVPYEKN